MSNPNKFDPQDLDRNVLNEALQSLSDYYIPKDRLRIREQTLGVGGFGTVKLADLSPSTGPASGNTLTTVAVKKLRTENDGGVLLRNAFRLAREMKVWALCKHANILEFTGYYLSEDFREAYLVSPYIANGNINNYLSRGAPSQEPRLKLVLGTIKGLAYLHTREPPIVHGDLKSLNVLVTNAGEALLCDFGLAKAMGDKPTGLTTSNGFKGTLRYTSPELFFGSPQNCPSDIWAWGCLALEIFTGNPPYHEIQIDTQVALLICEHEDHRRTPEPSDTSSLPSATLDLMRMCWSFEPGQRPDALQCVDKVEAMSLSPTLLSSGIPGPLSSGRVPDSPPAPSSRVLTSGVASDRVPDLGSRTSHSIRSWLSTNPSGRASDPLSITSRRITDSLSGSGVPSSTVASRRVLDSHSGTKEANPHKQETERIIMYRERSRTDAHSPPRSLYNFSMPSSGSLGSDFRNSLSNSLVVSRQSPSEQPWSLPASGLATWDPPHLGRYLSQSILVIQSKANRDQVDEFFYLVAMADNETFSREVRQGIDALVIRVVNEPQNESEVKSAVEMMNECLESLGNSDPRRRSSKIAEAWKNSKRLREGTEAKRMGEALLNQRWDETTPSEGLKEYHLRVDVRHETKLDVTKYKICFTVPGRAQHGQVDNLIRYAAASGMVYQPVNGELRPINRKISIARRAVLYDRKSASDWDHVRRTTAIRDLQDTARLQLVNTTSETFSIAAIQQTTGDPTQEPVLFGLSHPREVYDCLRKKNDSKYDALRSAIQLSISNGTSNRLENITNLENILKEKRFALIKPSRPNSVLPSAYSPFRGFPIPQFTGTLPSTSETTESNRISIYSEGSNSTSRTSSYHSLVETLGQPDVIVFPNPATPNDGRKL